MDNNANNKIENSNSADSKPNLINENKGDNVNSNQEKEVIDNSNQNKDNLDNFNQSSINRINNKIKTAPRDFIKGLLAFLKEYSVIGLAIGLIIGQASKDLVDAMVNGLFMPLIQLIILRT